jgi:hypothetical protein
MMVRIDFSGRAKRGARAIHAGIARESGVAILAEPGPHLPFRDGSIDELFVGRAIAWRDDIARTLDEIWRVSRPGALIHMTLPHASSTLVLSRDPHPRPALTLNTFNYYDPRTKPADAPPTAFAVERARLRVAGPRTSDTGLALARGPFAQFVEKLANGSRGSQYRFERWFANLIGGFEEFDVVLAVVKQIERRHPTQLARELGTLPGDPSSTRTTPAADPAAADATGLRATSDIEHEVARIDAREELLPNAAPQESGPPYIAHPFGDSGGGG